MKVNLIKITADKLEHSIWNMARDYPEGRNVLIRCLVRGAKKTEREVIEWLKENNIKVCELNKYKSGKD